ncbi:MAG: ABC transporter ATP-binding protein/permease [Clostridia bacterium]|nr:ABC transporter ATP-binding protein/permease [Clostridia bacterium]
MLKLDNITKVYEMGDLKVEALKGISLEFRKNEFVSVLGPSGCGKTTLLNIIGGLDRYTTGDLVINNKSTKEYKDKDWDNYRNHSVGFVFQSYNLIPHQTVLENVELALTLSGVSKEERHKRAIAVLEKVGLKDKIKNKPNQLSGGQMQRVAIARALVNDPEIILADEPTGALDSSTSVQIMELLKEISKDKLIIMVTHNPELAEQYSSRIVKLLDGNLIDDSNPFTEEEGKKEKPLLGVSDDSELNKTQLKKKNTKKKMSFWTALSLSFKNLLTKKGRTILVSIAGSIGIIGIALILAISTGFSTYINKMQEDTLSSTPITIESKSIDFTSIVTQMFLDQAQNDKITHDKDGVYIKENITNILNNVGNNLNSNNLDKFYTHLQENYDEIKDYVNGIQYTYDLDLEFYNPEEMSMIPTIPENVQPNSTALMDMVIKYALFYFEYQTKTIVEQLPGYSAKISKNGEYTIWDWVNKNYNEDLGYIRDDLENTADETPGYIILSANEVFKLISKLTGVNFGASSDSSSGGAAMTFSQMKIFYEMLDNQELIKSQYDLVGANSRYTQSADEALLVLDKNHEVDDYILYSLGLISEPEMDNTIKKVIKGDTQKTKIDYDKILENPIEYKVLTESDYFVFDSNLNKVVDIRLFNKATLGKDEQNNDIANPDYNPEKYYQYYAIALQNCTNTIKIVGIVRPNESTDNGCLSVGVAYSADLTDNLITYYNSSKGVESGAISSIDKGNPTTINIYINSFESKEHIKNFITKYNNSVANEDKISYTDLAGMIMGTVSTIITSITYVLIAFVSVSLVVSSIMIGIITYISVIERTKEIGVLRSVGASKKDVKRVFTAESFIIGFASGMIGILVSLLLTIPINLVLKHFTGIWGLAALPVGGAIALVVISVVLTLIAGVIPANFAAKKDPVVALRSN